MFRLVEALAEEAEPTVNPSEDAAKIMSATKVIERIEIIFELSRNWLRLRKKVVLVVDVYEGRCCQFRSCHVSSKVIFIE